MKHQKSEHQSINLIKIEAAGAADMTYDGARSLRRAILPPLHLKCIFDAFVQLQQAVSFSTKGCQMCSFAVKKTSSLS